MKTQLNSLNRTANTTKISGEGNSHILKCLLTILLLLTLGVGEMWADVWIRGDMNNWENSDDWKFNDGKLEVSLEANTDYTFKVWDEVSYGNDHYRSYDLNGGKITGTIVKYNLDKDNVADYNLVLHTDEAGTYIFQYAYEDSKYKLSIYFPKARLQKQKYVYFDARRLTGSNSDYWQRGDFTARFWFKYYDSGSDNGSVDCNKDNALENWVYYALVPDHDYIGQIQLNRLQVETEEALCVANIAHAKDRPSSLENCLQEESGKEDYCNAWTPQWTTYCPPMSSVTMADNGTTNWGGDGSSATPYLVPTGGDIKVHVTASASALDDANMTQYFLFKREGSAVGSGAASTEKTITASSITGTKEAVIVEAYNYYNATEGTHLPSAAIYYEARTPYTISYNNGTPAASISGSRESEIKLKDVTFTLPGAVFTRTGYTQTGWATSDGGAKAYELSASYTDNAALALYPVWTPKNYTVTLEGMEADSDDPIMVNVTYDAVLPLLETKHTKAHYDLLGYWAANDDHGMDKTKQLIDGNGNWIPDVADYTGNDGEGHPTWIRDGINISLFADWTEHPYTVTTSVSPAGAGTLSCGSSVTAKWVTPSELITATANPAWKFVRWEYGTNVGPADGTGLDNTVQIKASVDGTLTAVFEPRFCLVGAKWDNSGNGGMPGWHDYDHTADFIVNSYTDLSNMNLTCVQSLDPNTTYTFMVYDKVKEKNIGYAASEQYIGNQSLLFNTEDQYAVALRVNGYGPCTFTISALSSGDLYPTVSVAIPASHQLNLEWADVDIDNNWNKTSRGTGGSVSAQTTESGHNFAILNGEYVAHGGDITYTATPATGYTFEGWYNDDYNTRFSTTNPYTSSNIQTTENVQAKFVEKATAVTLSNDGHGKVQIGGEDATNTTCGVTTTRQLNAVPNSGYSFSSWSITGSDISLSAPNTNPTTLTGGGSGASSQSVTANFSANNYTITLNDKHGGTTSASVTYDATSLTSISHASFEGWDLLGYWNTDGNKVIEANGDIVANVVNYTGSSGEWKYANNVTLYAHWSRSITLDNQEGSSNGSVTVNYDESTTASLSAPSRTGYTVEGYYAETGLTTKVMNPDGTLVANVSGYTNSSSEWIHGTAAILYTKWTANNYIVNLENLGADEGYKGTENVSVTYNSSVNLTESITIPKKAHYDFGGYYTSSDEGVTLDVPLIAENGAWIASVDGYTDSDKNWLYADNLTLYAKWTETMYPVAIDIFPAGAGSVQISSLDVTKVTAGEVTWSSVLTPIAKPGWKFKEWQKTSSVDFDLEHYHSDYQTSGTNSMAIKAYADDQRLTAVFEPRYYLVGGEIMSGEDGVGTGTSSGMPGWDNYNKPFEIVTNSPILATCSLTLGTNKNFYIMVRDKADGFSYGKSGGVSLGDGTSLKFENKDNRVFFYSNGGTAYTFKITDVDGSGRPTVSVERPYQVNIGRKRVDIDGNDHDDNTGGTVDLSKQTAPDTWTPISNGDWVPYGISVKYNASKKDGYTLDWYTESDYATPFSKDPYWFHTATSTGNGYAKFTEIPTTVTLSYDGHGKVQIGGVDKTSTTCGVTTTRDLTAVPNDGYMFSSWNKSGDDITLSSTSTNPTTLRGKGSGATSGQEVRANFDYRWALKAESVGWGESEFIIGNISTNASGDVVGYVEISLKANTNYQFTMKDLLTSDIYKNNNTAVQFMTYTNHTDWGFDKTYTYNCGITTAGKGTYRFTWNVTDKTMTVTYPTSYQVNYASSVGGSVTSVKDGDNNDVPNGGYVCSGGRVTFTAAANTYYTFVGWCNNETYGDPFNNDLSWTNNNVTETQNSFAKFKSTNFVIYRTGDKASDPRAVWDDVESYEGGTISEAIEFRMKVNELDYWYTLCLPFEVNAVQVWEDGTYYEIEPYWRTEGKFYTGHYILRRPVTTTNFAIEGFEGKDRWIDPKSRGVLPSKNIPYIIQWHDKYFQDKYISFFGSAGQTIPKAMDEVSYASSDETVNIYGNNSMTTGTVRDAYLLDPDYGPDGAWMREELETYRSVLPFECFILANEKTTAKYRVLRRDMADDTPTGLDTLSKTEDTVSKVLIDNRIYIIRGGKIYTIQGTFVKEVE